jgi:hypothetical protein
MSAFFGFISFASLMLFFIGIIKPEAVIRWGEKRDRKTAIKYFGTAFLLSFIIAFVFKTGSPSKAEDSKYPYHFVKSQDQRTGEWKDTMDLYYCSDPINLNQLKEFCAYKKAGFSSDGTYYLVIFNNETNAVFPKDPFGAHYSLEEPVLKNIRAFYVFRKPNGVSTLQYYEKNKLESKVQEEKI